VAASRLTRPGWRLLGGLALLAIIIVGAPRLFEGLEFFKIRKVEIRGTLSLRPDDVARALPIRAGQSIFMDLAPLQRAADSIEGIASARVSRRLPGTIVVTIREVKPIALVMRKGRLAMVGTDGEVLAFDPVFAVPDLPVVREADSLVTQLLSRVRDTDATFFGRVVSGWRDGDDVVVAAEGQRFWFRPDAGAEVIRAVLAVEQDLEQNARPWTDLDARFAGQVVVRRVPG
jgi:hypothetical protein